MPYGFPSGAQLVTDIIRGTAQGGALRQLLTEARYEGDAAEAFHTSLRYARPKSIDAFLASRPQWRDMGKLTIAAVLIPFELEAALYSPESPDADWLHT